MALLSMVLKKMLKNKWLVISFLLGLIISVALITSIPLYTNGVLQKMLIKELENYQLEEEKFPGDYLVSIHLDEQSINDAIRDAIDRDQPYFKDEKVLSLYQKWFDNFDYLDSYMDTMVKQNIDIPVLDKVFNYSTDVCGMVREGMDGSSDPYGRRYVKIQSLTDLEKHIKLIDGRMPSTDIEDDIYEVLVSEQALNKLKILVDKTYEVSDLNKKGMSSIKVKPVGVFTVKDENDPYWAFFKPQNFSEDLIIPENLMREHFIEAHPVTLLYSARWYYALDYHALNIAKLSKIVSGHNKFVRAIKSRNKDAYIDAPIIKTIGKYFDTERQLHTMMWILNMPVIVMLGLYLFMVCQLIINREKNEIALMSSRGASRTQITLGYLLQGLILGVIALILGPQLGLLMCRLLGSSSGFLEFVQRKGLPVSINNSTYIYAAFTVGVSMIIIAIPAYRASRVSIVDYKRNITRPSKMTIWEKIGLDFILLAISAYGFYSFTQRQTSVHKIGISGGDIAVDPLFFFIPALFILGTGLLCIRLYPYMMKFIYWLGKKIWPAHLYNSLIKVSRSMSSYHFLMIFLVMTLSIGLFSATAARTINKNAEERIMYDVGCDMVLQPVWQSYTPSTYMSFSIETSKESALDGRGNISKNVQYSEPSFLPYTELPGVEHAAKVFVKEDVWLESSGYSVEGIDFMGIESYDFGNVAWFRSDLLSHHINEYLNLLGSESSACLISRSISENFDIKPGDQVRLGWHGSNGTLFTVYAIIDYWPSWNPNRHSKDKIDPMLVVANLSYVHDYMGLEPYEIWLKLKPDAKSSQVYEGIKDKKLPVLSMTDANQRLIKMRNDPSKLVINGTMTLGFIISGIICFLGFLLYWALSLGSRTMEFGVLRAMGLSLKHLIFMIIWEQIFTSGAAVIMGIFIGLVASNIFVPLFQMTDSAVSQVPPFRIISYANDRIKIYIFIIVTLCIGITILGYLLSSIKIDQAIKLGED